MTNWLCFSRLEHTACHSRHKHSSPSFHVHAQMTPHTRFIERLQPAGEVPTSPNRTVGHHCKLQPSSISLSRLFSGNTLQAVSSSYHAKPKSHKYSRAQGGKPEKPLDSVSRALRPVWVHETFIRSCKASPSQSLFCHSPLCDCSRSWPSHD